METTITDADEKRDRNKRDHSRYKVNIDQLLRFLFPPNLQHPLTAGRLFAFGECGPLDEDGNLQSGFKGKHVLADYELEEMCMQYEREDLIKIYLHKPQDYGKLLKADHDMIISQADNKLKVARGKAMLPRLTRDEVMAIFEGLERDENGCIVFHAAQREIERFRETRLREFKKVFPDLGAKSKTSKTTTMKTDIDAAFEQSNRTAPRRQVTGRVSESIAPMTMFQKMKGQTNSDIGEENTNHLSKHAFRVTSIGEPATASDVTSNVRLLRENGPRMPNPFVGADRRPDWSTTCNLKGTGLGSQVDTLPSSTTWKRNTTLY